MQKEPDAVALEDGFFDVPDGRIAAVVTHLEMLERAPARDEHEVGGLTLRHVTKPEAAWYRALFARVGAQDWLWFSRLKCTDPALEEIIHHPLVEVHAVESAGNDEGLLELDFREDRSCELAFFGVSRALVGTGAGRFLMNRAIEHAWARDIDRFHVHTCTLDHPNALQFYMRSGFVPFARQIEIAADPRLSGLLPKSAAPQVPIIEPS